MTRPPLEVADLIRAAGTAFFQHSRKWFTWLHLKVLTAIVCCRTSALGGHIDECSHCGHRAISFNSCRNRHCPKCQSNARARWLEARRRELLPTPYVHVVFTLPGQLAALALQNKREVYSLLFRASAETLLAVARDPRHLGAEIGFFSVLQTWIPICSAGVTEQTRGLQPLIPGKRRDAAGRCARPAASRRRDRLLQRVAHLESETAASPACPLRGSGRWIGSRSHPVDRCADRLLFARQSPQPCLSRQVRRRSAGTACHRQARISRWPCAAPIAARIRGHAALPVPFRLGRVFQAPFWRGRTRAPLSGLLHASRRNLESSAGGARQWPGHVSMARLGPQE